MKKKKLYAKVLKHSLKLEFSSVIDPTDGGGYTITQDILNTILKRFKNYYNF